jgi:fatty-acyl-CoA synthase
MSQLLTIADAVATHARLTPEKTGARDSKRSLSYAAWNERASRLGSALLGLGLRQGDRVGVVAYNCIEWMEMYVAMARAGLVVVPLNFRLTGPEMAYILDHAEVSAIISGPEFTTTLDGLRAELRVDANRYITLAQQAPQQWLSYEDLMNTGDTQFKFAAVGPQDMCALMYTSGTTVGLKAPYAGMAVAP